MFKSIYKKIYRIAYDLSQARRTVLISVPHSYWTSNEYHDDMALDFAKMIASHIKGAVVKVFPSDTARKDMDMNRYRSRDTAYRKILEVEMMKLDPEDVVLDVHSAKTCDFDIPFEVVLLDIDEQNLFTFDLNKHLRAYGINSYVIDGTLDNDILLMARRGHDLDNSVLIEINRDLSDEKMCRIAHIIAGYINGGPTRTAKDFRP